MPRDGLVEWFRPYRLLEDGSGAGQIEPPFHQLYPTLSRGLGRVARFAADNLSEALLDRVTKAFFEEGVRYEIVEVAVAVALFEDQKGKHPDGKELENAYATHLGKDISRQTLRKRFVEALKKDVVCNRRSEMDERRRSFCLSGRQQDRLRQFECSLAKEGASLADALRALKAEDVAPVQMGLRLSVGRHAPVLPKEG